MLTKLILGLTLSLISSPVLAEKICGEASWYEYGTRTANGERFDKYAMTAAMPHRKWMGHIASVTNMRTGKVIHVRINDYGPAAWTHRVIDLSKGSAHALGLNGIGPVCIEIH